MNEQACAGRTSSKAQCHFAMKTHSLHSAAHHCKATVEQSKKNQMLHLKYQSDARVVFCLGGGKIHVSYDRQLGASESTIEAEKRRLEELQNMLFHDFRRDVLNRLKRQSDRVGRSSFQFCPAL